MAKTISLLVGLLAAAAVAGAPVAAEQQVGGTETEAQRVYDNEEFGVSPGFGEDDSLTEEDQRLQEESGDLDRRNEEEFGLSPQFDEEEGFIEGEPGLSGDEGSLFRDNEELGISPEVGEEDDFLGEGESLQNEEEFGLSPQFGDDAEVYESGEGMSEDEGRLENELGAGEEEGL